MNEIIELLAMAVQVLVVSSVAMHANMKTETGWAAVGDENQLFQAPSPTQNGKCNTCDPNNLVFNI